MIKSLQIIANGKSYAERDIAMNKYLEDFKKQVNRPISVIDIGGGSSTRSPETTHVVDLLPLKTEFWDNQFQGEFIQGDIDLSDVWEQLFEYVKQNGKFDFLICSHTLEDINAPHQAILNFFKIANAGMIAVPSKYIETIRWENLNGPYHGYHHHRWIYTVKNGIFYGYPKSSTLDNHFRSHDFVSRSKYQQKFGREGYQTQTEMTFLWENSFPMKFISPFMYHHVGFTENKRSAFIDLLEQDDICNIILETK